MSSDGGSPAGTSMIGLTLVSSMAEHPICAPPSVDGLASHNETCQWLAAPPASSAINGA